MPVQLKIFRIINYLIIVPTVLIIFAWIVSTGLKFHTVTNLITFIIVLICGIILIVNSIINHLWLERYYPENYPEKSFRNFSTLFFVLMILVLLLFAGIFIAGLYSLFLEEYERNDSSWGEYVGFGLIGFIVLSGIYLLVYRIRLRRLVRRNQQRQFNNFLEINS